MSKNLIKGSLLATTVIAGMAFTAPAFAQSTDPVPAPAVGEPTPTNTQGNAPPAAPDDANIEAGPQTSESAGPAEPTSAKEIVVTGTLIRNPNLVASAPVQVVGQEEIQLRQSNVAEEVLRTIPGAAPSVGSNTNNGNGGASFVNLRGLGVNRNIVLLDGVRIVPANLGGSVDLNNIPLALVDRVDVLTGGASSTYGADAISGVVNFITRSDFAGVELAVGDSITQRGDGNTIRADLTIGANFDDGRGNAVLSLGYQEADPVYFGGSDRPFSQVTLESYDEFFVAGQGSSTTTPSAFDNTGQPGGRQQISPDGQSFVPFYSAFNFNPFNVFQVPFKRYNMYGAGHYDINDGLTVYARGLYSDNTVSTIIAPSGVFGSAVTVPVSNPFLTAAQRTQLCATADTNPNVAGRQTLTPAQCAAAAAATDPTSPDFRSFTFGLRRRTVELGPRISEYNTKVFDFRAGVRGDITDTIGFDVFGSHGRSQNRESIQGYAGITRVRQALLATNADTCIDPSGGCVPLNIFGPPGSITPEQANFINVRSSVARQVNLSQGRAIINGDLFGVKSPYAAEPISFAAGAEYRKYKAVIDPDSLASNPGELGGSGGAVDPIDGGYDVYEGFAEIVAPLVSDRPFFDELTVEAGIRRSHYTVDTTGNPKYNTTTWKVAGSWQPIADVKFRGNYQKAVRAPNVGELFSPVSTGLTNLGTDPCAGAAPLSNANLAAVCIAQGGGDFLGIIDNPTAGQANVTGGGNPNLKPETSKSYTVGVVLRPRFIPGLTATLDYYNIKVKDAVSSPTPADVITACFGADPTNPPAGAALTDACTSIRRNPQSGGLDGDPATTGGLFASLSNLGKIFTDGFDLNMNYRRGLGDLMGAPAKLALSFAGNYTRNSQFQATPTSINRECVGFYSVNCGSPNPKYSFNQRTTLSLGKVDLSLLWRYAHKLRLEPVQLAADLAAADAANRDADGNLLDPADQGCPNFETDAGDAINNGGGACVIDTRFRKIKAYNYFDFATRFNVNENFDFTFNIINLFDKKPPVVGGTVGSTAFNGGNTYPASYDTLGRRFAAGARVKF